MAHRLKKGQESILIPWVTPIKLKSDAPKEIIKVIDVLPTLGALRGMWASRLPWLNPTMEVSSSMDD
eukprot:11078249-Prorocentrum_lima.AAC.1